MKLHLDRHDSTYLITGYTADHVLINGQPHAHSVLLLPDEVVADWLDRDSPAPPLDQLSAHHFANILTRGPEIVLLGTGSTQRFPSPALYQALLAARIGVEVMNTPAACRTYNILVGEGRRVAAALWV